MKISKDVILEKMKNGAVLIQKFDRMYGTYYFLNDIDGNVIYNINLKSISSIKNISNKIWIDKNIIEYHFNINN